MAAPLKKNEAGPMGGDRSSDRGTDPLYVIFEQHLYNFPEADVDRRTFVLQIVAEYLTYLRRKKISIPRSLEGPIVEELANQVNSMLVKKIYGCLTIEEFRAGVSAQLPKRARLRYRKLAKTSR